MPRRSLCQGRRPTSGAKKGDDACSDYSESDAPAKQLSKAPSRLESSGNHRQQKNANRQEKPARQRTLRLRTLGCATKAIVESTFAPSFQAIFGQLHHDQHQVGKPRFLQRSPQPRSPTIIQRTIKITRIEGAAHASCLFLSHIPLDSDGAAATSSVKEAGANGKSLRLRLHRNQPKSQDSFNTRRSQFTSLLSRRPTSGRLTAATKAARAFELQFSASAFTSG